MPSFNWFDIVLFLVLVGSILGGVKAGFARVVIGLAATLAGMLAGFWFYRLVADKLLPYLNGNTGLANLIGFFLIFAGVLILGALLAALLSKIFQWIGLSWFNHALGGLAGVIRGVLVITILVDVLVAFTPPPTPGFLGESHLLPYTNEVSAFLIDVAPRELKDSFEQQMGAVRQFWTPHHRTAHDQKI